MDGAEKAQGPGMRVSEAGPAQLRVLGLAACLERLCWNTTSLQTEGFREPLLMGPESPRPGAEDVWDYQGLGRCSQQHQLLAILEARLAWPSKGGPGLVLL